MGSSAFARRYLRNRFLSFSSSGYLDVSVHRVPSVNLWIQLTVHTLRMWVPPFRDLRIFVYVPLPAAFRSLSRLSSALSAKASALCSWCFFSVMTYRSQPSSKDDRYSVTDHLLFCLNLLGYHSKISDVFLLFFVRYSVFGFQGANAGLNRLTGFCSQTRMEMVRFELMTPCLQGRCSPN